MSDNESLVPLKSFLFSFYATNTIIISFLPLYLQYKGLNGTEIGWVLAIGPLATIFSQPFWGYLSDKYKTVKRILLICVICMLLISIVFFQMDQLMTILFAGAFFYFFSTPIGALGDSLGQRRAQDLGVPFGSIRTWGSIGFATSALIIGAVLGRLGIQYMIWPYLLFGLFAILFAVRLKDVQVSSEPVQIKDVKKMFQNKPYVFFLIFIIFVCVSHRANDSFVGLYIAELGGIESYVGLAWFVGVASEALVFATAGFWFRKFHPMVFVIIAAMIYTIRWFLFAGANSPFTVIALQATHGITFGIFYLAAFDYIARLVPRTLQATGHLVFFAVFFGVSGIIGSLMGGALIETFGGSMLYNVIGFFALIGTICLTGYYVVLYNRKRGTV